MSKYSCSELLGFSIDGLPSTERGIQKKADREKWPFEEVKAKGGRGGVKKLYAPPPEILKKIQAVKLNRALADTGVEIAAAPAAMPLPVTVSDLPASPAAAVPAVSDGLSAAAASWLSSTATEAQRNCEAARMAVLREVEKLMADTGMGKEAVITSLLVQAKTRLHEVFSTQYGNIKLTREEFAALNAEIDRFNVGQPESMSVSRWIQYKNQLQAVKDGFAAVIRNAEAAGETVSQMARDGTISQQALARATQAAAEATGKLDAVRLSKLHAQIDEARQKLRQMQDEAREARETLEAELAGLNGNEEAAHELEARRKIEAWKKKAAEASDADAAAEYRKSAELQEQIYRRQREKREAEQREKQRAAQKPDWEALSEPKVDIPAGMADGLMNDLNRVLEKRDANVADAAVQALVEQIADGLRRMT